MKRINEVNVAAAKKHHQPETYRINASPSNRAVLHECFAMERLTSKTHRSGKQDGSLAERFFKEERDI